MASRNPSESERSSPGADNPGEEFEGSRPGPKTAIFVVGLVLAVVGYSYWPQIASALSLD
jgi:hypothetical protein